ncbi:synapse differentiation-inducing gene protein 1-like [Xenopus laevis]|uniref:Synapse differentiation-inducing gene protein 1-like n=1 Tax=Xenopus laevis TaxID=8355 RepID=A0A8J1L8Y8_XENLA|nr:synapse differentiation-inducing gene protein 1-like [Xenopus laevis]
MNYQDEYPKMIPTGDYSDDPPLYTNSGPTAHFIQPPSASQHAVVMNIQPVGRSYKDYLGCSIVNLICCCLPIGIAALIFSFKTREDIIRGDMVSADSDSRMALILNMVALGVGLLLNVLSISIFIYYIIQYNYIQSLYGQG